MTSKTQRNTSKTQEDTVKITDTHPAGCAGRKKEDMRDNFIAKECNFQGEPGYMVSQIHNGKKAVEQFIAKSCYKEFCEKVGIEPKIETDITK